MRVARDVLVGVELPLHVQLLRQLSKNHGRSARPWFFLRALVLTVLLSVPAGGAFAGKADELLGLADTLAIVNHQTRAHLIRSRYEALHRGRMSPRSSPAELLDAFKAADIATFYSHDPKIALGLLKLYELLDEQGIAVRSHAEAVLGSLVLTRELDAARAFNDENKVVPQERLIRLAQTPISRTRRQVLLDVEAANLVPREVDVSTGLRVLVTAHPACGYSRKAAGAIQADGLLRGFFDQRAVWIAPPTREPTNESIDRWNVAHPGQRLALAYRTSDWPVINDWSTPVFYFLRDGQLVDTVAGWPEDGSTHQRLRSLVSGALN